MIKNIPQTMVSLYSALLHFMKTLCEFYLPYFRNHGMYKSADRYKNIWP